MSHDKIKHSGVLEDWRIGEHKNGASDLTPAQKAPWAFDVSITRQAIHITLTAPDLTSRYAMIEIDKGDAVLRGYLSDAVMEEPVSLRLTGDKVEIAMPSADNAEHVVIKP